MHEYDYGDQSGRARARFKRHDCVGAKRKCQKTRRVAIAGLPSEVQYPLPKDLPAPQVLDQTALNCPFNKVFRQKNRSADEILLEG